MPGRQVVTTSGGTAGYQLVVKSVNGTAGQVNFAVTGLPAGATSSFNPATAGDGAATTLQLTVPAGISAGTYSPQVTGASGSLSHMLPLTLTVNSPAAGALPDTWLNENIGNSYGGTGTSYDNGTYTAQGAGSDIWGESDQFQYAYQTMKGDGILVARVANRQNVFVNTKVGVMIRDGLTGGSINAMFALYGFAGP